MNDGSVLVVVARAEGQASWEQNDINQEVFRCFVGEITAVIDRNADENWRCTLVIDNDPLKVIDSRVYSPGAYLPDVMKSAERYSTALLSYISEPTPRKRKLQERIWLEQARRLCPVFPDGDVFDSEEPDFLLSTGAGYIGVELTTLWEPPVASAFPRKTIAGNYDSIVKGAKKRYETSGRSPHDVHVMFSPEAEFERDANVLIDRLTHFVEANRDTGVCRSWEALSGPSHELPPGFAWIGIQQSLTHNGRWHCSHFGDVLPLSYGDVSKTVAQKNSRIPSYICNAAVNWLLLVVAFPNWGVPSIPNEARNWKFTSDFQKILLFSGEHGQVLDVGA